MDHWYSVMLNFVLAVDGADTVRRSRSVILLRGGEFDFDGVTERAIAKGRSMEAEYPNTDGALVRWSFEEVQTVDWIGPDIDDGREVYHEFTDDFPLDSLTFPLDPGASKPTQSGV